MNANQADNEALDVSLLKILKPMRYGVASTPKRKKRVRMNVEAGKSGVWQRLTTGNEVEDENLCVHNTSTTTPKWKNRVRMSEKALKSVAGINRCSIHHTSFELEEKGEATEEEDWKFHCCESFFR